MKCKRNNYHKLMLTKKKENSVEFQFKRMLEFKVKHYPNYNKRNENVKNRKY